MQVPGSQLWHEWAADLTAAYGCIVKVRGCPAGFELPHPDGTISHVSSPAAVRGFLDGMRRGRG